MAIGRRRPPLLAIAVVAGIGLPGGTLLLFAFEGWELPTALAVALPIILIGSLRGTAILLGWKAIRRLIARFRAYRTPTANTGGGFEESSDSPP
jgi:hypothetical protein